MVERRAPALQRRVVLVGDCPHHFPNVEGLLPPWIGFVRQNFADQSEALLPILTVGMDSHIPSYGIIRHGAPREALAGRDVGVVIVTEQNVAGFINVTGPVLCLAIDAHDAVVTANSLVVFRGDATGIIERALAGQHQGGLGRHDQDSASVHEHGGFGVPIGLSADVDAVDYHVHLAAERRGDGTVLEDAGADRLGSGRGGALPGAAGLPLGHAGAVRPGRPRARCAARSRAVRA